MSLCLALEEIARGSMSLAGCVTMQSLMGTKFLEMLGNADIRAAAVRCRRCAARRSARICMTEPNAGSDLGGIATTARKVDGGYLLKGQKTWVTSAPVADFFTVFARAGEERKLTIFLVEKELQRSAIGKAIPKMGVWALPTSELAFDDCFVPDSHRLSREEGDGEAHLRKLLAEIRIVTGALALGGARGALEEAIRYAGERQQFGKPINRYQAIQLKLAEMATDLEAARRLVHYAAWLKDNDRPHHKEAAMAKLFASEAAAQDLRQGGARARLLRLQHGICGAAPPARHPLHADRRRHQRDSQARSSPRSCRSERNARSRSCWPSPASTATTSAPRSWCRR